jgi:hypothetical protein
VALIVVNHDARTPVASRSDHGECRLHHPFSIASATEVQNQQPTRRFGRMVECRRMRMMMRDVV